MGRLIVIEGLDGSGKAMQSGMLTEHARTVLMGENVRKLTFPNYDSDSSALVKMYLEGAFGDKPDDVNAYAASAFYAVDRYAGMKQDWGAFYDAGGVLVADRYATSNAIHQCAKLPEEEWEGYISWLEAFEYEKLGLPKPDLVIFLDVAPEVSQQLMLHRYKGDAEKRDIHERDVAYLERCRKAAQWCAGRLGWKTLMCSSAGAMRPPDEINKKVWSIAKEVLWNSAT